MLQSLEDYIKNIMTFYIICLKFDLNPNELIILKTSYYTKDIL